MINNRLCTPSSQKNELYFRYVQDLTELVVLSQMSKSFGRSTVYMRIIVCVQVCECACVCKHACMYVCIDV